MAVEPEMDFSGEFIRAFSVTSSAGLHSSTELSNTLDLNEINNGNK
jgi:hypothetical protein